MLISYLEDRTQIDFMKGADFLAFYFFVVLEFFYMNAILKTVPVKAIY